MKKSNLILPITLLFALVFMLGFVSSALTINTPTASQAVNGTFKLNVTSSLSEALNCTFATTADGVFAKTKNASASQTEFTNSTNTALLTEAHLTTLNVTCYNATNIESATRSFTIDNTDPSCSFISSSSFVNWQSPIGVSMTQQSTDTSTITYVWNLTDESTVQQATYTTSEPTFTNGDLDTIGTNTITLTITDEVRKTDSCTETLLVKQKDGTDAVIIQSEQNKSSNMTLFIIIGGVFFVVIVGAGAFVVLERGKKKR